MTTPQTRPTDVWLARGVVVALGLIALACVVGGLVVVVRGQDVPGEIIAIGSSAGGALAALLSRVH